jgi:digeranylgeranylglycerophospholipid reductase
LIDVAVIGGGPVGSRVAFQLVSMGHSVMVLEKHPAIGQKTCCTGIISQKCLNQFSVPEEVIYRRLNSATFYSPSCNSIRLFLSQPQAGIVNRPLFDRWLAGQAVSEGAKYLMNCDVKQVNVTPEWVEIEYQKAKSRGKIQARAVVLACGFNSSLVKQLGLGQPGYVVTGVQAEVETKHLQEIEVYFNQTLAPGFFAWLAPTLPGKALAGLMTRESPGQHLKVWLNELAAKEKIKKANYTVKYNGIPLKTLTATVLVRVLVVGDAAGQVKPTTGGGIYFGLLCADLAADTLHKAILTGDYSFKSLSGYEKEWRDQLQSELKREYWARRAYQLLSNRQIDSLFKTIQLNGIVDSLLKEEYASFDNHGSLLIKALKLGLVSHARRFSSYLTR